MTDEEKKLKPKDTIRLSENELKELKDIRSEWRPSSIDMTPEPDLDRYKGELSVTDEENEKKQKDIRQEFKYKESISKEKKVYKAYTPEPDSDRYKGE